MCDGCYCGHRQKIWLHNELKFWTPTWMQMRLGGSKRHVSAEIEVAKCKPGKSGEIRNAVDKWSGSIVPDGSVSSGFEINTAPAGGDLFFQQITEICAALKAAGSSVDNRCGLHVHIDARDMHYYDIARLCRLYIRIEPALFDMVSEDRRRNLYCLPTAAKLVNANFGLVKPDKRSKAVKAAVFRGMYNTENKDYIKGTRLGKYPRMGGRYWALNLHSWMHRGSIECRLFGGTVVAKKIILWGTMWAMILDWVMAHSDVETDALLAANSGSHETLLAVFSGKREMARFIRGRWRTQSHAGAADDEGP